MSCAPVSPPGGQPARLEVDPPWPQQPRLARRPGTFDDLLAALIADIERSRPVSAGPPLGREWDVEGDPRALRLARLWAYVAEGVAAYAELTAGESYLGTAADWTDLRRLATLVGYQPRPRVAAQGWVRVDTDRGASPVITAGTRVQAAATATRAAQTFEVVEDTQLRADWAGLTVTPVPRPSAPPGRTLRFLHDPGFEPGDRVLFVLEQRPPASLPLLAGTGWFSYWASILQLLALALASQNTPLAIAVVEQRETDLGTVLVTFDRDLSTLLPGTSAPYAAYRIIATAGSARRLSKAVKLAATDSAVGLIPFYQAGVRAVSGTGTGSQIVLDVAFDDLSAGQLVALVDWSDGGCDLATVQRQVPVEWEIAPGAPSRVTRLEFPGLVGTLARAGQLGRPVTAYVVDRRVVARHYEIPAEIPGGTPPRLRVYPAPAAGFEPPRMAVRSGGQDKTWELFSCAPADAQEDEGAPGGQPAPRGLVLDLLDGMPAGPVDHEPASANVVRVRHGASTASTLGSGDATRADLTLAVPKAPVAYDLAADGTPASSLQLRVDGVAWQEVPTLSGAGPVQVYVATLGPDGSVTVRFGDGRDGARPPTGRNNVTATHRVGGGTDGELPSGAIDTLLGSIPGVKGVAGVGRSAGGADQDDERRLRRLAPVRARALGRAVTRDDLADLTLAYPGVSHAAAWRGPGPPGCACGVVGLHAAFLRLGADGPRAPLPAEITALAGFLDGRRDPAVALCVCAAEVLAVLVDATIATHPRHEQARVVAAARAALRGDVGALDPLARRLGQPLDRSDVLAAVHAVAGVEGVGSLILALDGPTSGPGGPDRAGAAGTRALVAAGVFGRLPARRWQLLVVSAASTVTGVPA